jgi:GNAT superfamily N-acetyltransferase
MKGVSVASSTDRPVITIEELDADDAQQVADFYRRVLAPHFPADELETSENIAAGLKSGGTRALAARTAEGTIVGGAVGDLFPSSRVMLLSYLAVAAEGRGTGTGGLLMKALTDLWGRQFSPPLLIMEVEDPRHYHSDPDHSDPAFGDPVARVRFYERLGARALPVPYFQPALGPDGHRVPHLMLMVFGGTDAPPGTAQVDGNLVELFLTEYLETCEGPVRPDDVEAQRLLAACRRPGGLPLLRVSELPSFDN